jgi:hypothetical protein
LAAMALLRNQQVTVFKLKAISGGRFFKQSSDYALMQAWMQVPVRFRHHRYGTNLTDPAQNFSGINSSPKGRRGKNRIGICLFKYRTVIINVPSSSCIILKKICSTQTVFLGGKHKSDPDP